MGESYQCRNCGATMEFDVKTQTLRCAHCGNSIEILNDTGKIVEHTLTSHSLAALKPEEKHSQTMVCSGCGAKLEIDANSTATECPYCGSNYVLSEKQESAILPDGVLPFKLDGPQVQTVIRNWMKRRYLAPSKLKQLYQQGKIQGIYLPFWTFDADGHCYYTAMGGINRVEHYEDSEGKDQTRIHTDWYPTSGNVDHFYNDVLIQASDKLTAKLLRNIEPYDLNQVASYSPEYFSGYSAECYNIDLEQAHRQAVANMQSSMEQLASQDVLRRYDQVSQLRTRINLNDQTFKHIVLPIYATTYGFNGKTYSILINGQNGQISGEYPKSAAKITAIVVFILILAASFYFLYQYGENNKQKATDARADYTIEAVHETDGGSNGYYDYDSNSNYDSNSSYDG